MSIRRRQPGAVRPPDGGQSFQIMEPVIPVYLIPMPKAQRVVPIAADPDWDNDVIEVGESSANQQTAPPTPNAKS